MDADNAMIEPPHDAQSHLEAACAELDGERYDAALRECRAALDLAPEWAEAHNLHGLILDEVGRLHEAAEAYHTALRLDPDHVHARDNLLGTLTEMMAGELNAPANLDDDDPDQLALLHLEWGYELLDEEDDDDLELALWESDLVINLSPELADAHNLRGIVLDALGRPQEAVAAFRTAVELDPDFAEARENLQALEAEEAGGPDAPADQWEPCPICGAANPPAASHCRQCGFGLAPGIPADEPLVGDVPVPVREPDITPDDEPGRPAEAQSRLDLAYNHNERGEFTDALRECDAILQVAPRLAEAHNLRGIVLEALDRPEEALDAYRTAVQLEPAFGDARENLHELLSELGADDPVVTVTTFTNPLEAHAARLALAEHGIWSLVLDESLQITGIRLVARESDLQDIVQVLDLETDEDEGWQCPRCGSWEVDIPLVGRKRRCDSCGHEWKV